MKYPSRKTTTHIVIHCTATPEGRDVTAKDVDRMHRQRGFNGIGYHFVVRLDGRVEIGRPVDAVGAHVAGHNSTSVGISYVGGVHADDVEKAKDTRTKAQKETLIKLIKELKAKYPKATVLGHRDFPKVAKACPCFNAKAEYAGI